MRVVDLHPEDLLEKDAAGTLDAAERARLDAHLAHCPACSLERQLRADFAVELEADVPSVEPIGLGLERASPVIPPARESMMRLRSPRSRRPLAKTVVWLLAAAAALVGGAAAAAMGLNPVPWMRSVFQPATVAPAEKPEMPQKRQKPQNPLGEAPAREPSSNLPLELEPTAGPQALPAPLAVSVSVPQAPARAPIAPVATVAHAHPVHAAPPPTVVGPAEVFESESAARRSGDYERTLNLDRDLQVRYPTSREAQVSRAIVGRLLLDRGDPAAALAKFQEYLAAGSGQLGEEAMVGRATALERLGRADDAARAWAALVAAFPESPYAAHARARLESSNGP